MSECVYSGVDWQLVPERANGACVEQYSPNCKLHRSRVLQTQWLLWWQQKNLKLEIFCCDSRMRLIKLYPVLRLLFARPVFCVLKLLLHVGFLSLVCCDFLFLPFYFRWFECFVFLLIFNIFVQVKKHMLAGSWLSEMEMCVVFKKLGTPPITVLAPKPHHRAKI